jgi:outer membrane protein TolC
VTLADWTVLPAAEPSPAGPSAPLTIAACRQIALEHQPAVAAARASLSAAIARSQALDQLHVPGLVSRDLPIRRQQAALGVTVAEGGVRHAESDAVYAVTYTYLAALYAVAQHKVALDARQRLEDLRVVAKEARQERKDVFDEHQDLINSYLHVVDGRDEETLEGRQRALAGLREALGVGPEFEINLPARSLPCPKVEPKMEVIRALAVERRGELLQATTAEQITSLEIDAQHAISLPTGRTFAAGSDIHAQPLRTGSYGQEYSPAAVGLEMPTTLAGSKHARMEQAGHYHDRAVAVADKTRQLIALEAEDAFLRWQEKSAKARKLRKAVVESQKFSDRLRAKFDTKQISYPTLNDVLHAGVITTRLDIEALEAQFQSLVALAVLERVTAGGFCVDFDAPCEP